MIRVALVAAAALALAGSAGGAGKALTFVGVSADEYTLLLSRDKVREGETLIELANFGEDPHDLNLQRAGATKVFDLGNVLPDQRGELQVRLKPGRYVLWCSYADHRALGMEALLAVKRK